MSLFSDIHSFVFYLIFVKMSKKNWLNMDKSNFSTYETDLVVCKKFKDVPLGVLFFAENKIKNKITI